MGLILFAAGFVVTALLYAMVGFGGGSTYNSLLLLGGIDYQLIPVISLTCNLVVVTGGLLHFGRSGYVKPDVILPFLLTSVPCAAIGGAIFIAEQWFIGILGSALVVSGLLLLRSDSYKKQVCVLTMHQRWQFGLPVGAGLGLLSGITGIGGGIFLAPLMYLTNWAQPKIIAASASLFIFVNSIFGLAGQLSKYSDDRMFGDLLTYLALPLTVLIGGQIGSYLGSGFIREQIVRSITGILVLLVGSRILVKALL